MKASFSKWLEIYSGAPFKEGVLEGKKLERARVLEMLKADLAKWKAEPNSNDPQVNIGIVIATETLIKKLEESRVER